MASVTYPTAYDAGAPAGAGRGRWCRPGTTPPLRTASAAPARSGGVRLDVVREAVPDLARRTDLLRVALGVRRGLHGLRGGAGLPRGDVGDDLQQAGGRGMLAEAEERVECVLLVPDLIVGAPAHRRALLEQAAGVRVHGRLVVVQPRLDDRGDQGDHGDVLAEVVALDHGDEELRVLLLPVVHRLRQEALAVLGAGQELLGPLAGPGLRAPRSGGCRCDGAGGRCGGEAESAGDQQAAAG